MKRVFTYNIIAIFIISTILSLTNCSTKALNPCSEAHYKYGQKAVEIADLYLEYEITSDEARSKLDKLIKSSDELPETETRDITHTYNVYIETGVTFLRYELSVGRTEYNDVKKQRDDLFNTISKCKIYE